MGSYFKAETEIEIISPAEKFYKAFKNQKYHLPNCSDKIHEIKVHEGDWHTVGSVRQWNYSLDGFDEIHTAKEHIEEADDERMIIKYVVYGGDVSKHFKSFKPTIQVFPKGKGGLVKWTLEFEKLEECAHEYDTYVGFATSITKHLDAFLVGA